MSEEKFPKIDIDLDNQAREDLATLIVYWLNQHVSEPSMVVYEESLNRENDVSKAIGDAVINQIFINAIEEKLNEEEIKEKLKDTND